MWSKHLSRWICGDGIDGKKYTIDKADSDKGDSKRIQSFQENTRKAVSCSRILQWLSNLKRPRIKHQGARIIARYPATYICVSFPDRSSAAGPHNQGYKTDSEVWRFRKFGVWQQPCNMLYCTRYVAHTEVCLKCRGLELALRFLGRFAAQEFHAFYAEFCRFLSNFGEKSEPSLPQPSRFAGAVCCSSRRVSAVCALDAAGVRRME